MTACRNQCLCCLILSIPSFLASFGLVWPSYAIWKLAGDDTPLNTRISGHDSDFIGSFPMLGSFVVSLFVGSLSDCIGRKNSELLCGLLLTLSWAIITTSKTVTQLLIGRVIFGTSFGIHFVVGLIFCGEMAHPSTTGTATSALMFAYSMGALSSYLAGWFLGYELICYINLSLGVIFVVAVSFMKETPAFLIGKGKEKEALQSLKFYRGASTPAEDILEEYNYIKSQRTNNVVDSTLEKSNIGTEHEKLNNGIQDKRKKQLNAWKILLTSKSAQREVLSITVVVVLTMSMGMLGIQTYAGPLFSEVIPSLSPDLCSVVLAVVLAVSSGVSAAITDLFGRRVLLLWSLSGAACSMAVLSSQLRWSWAPNWLVPLAVVVYCISYQLGANNVPFVLAAEMFTPEIRGLGMQLMTCFICVANFIVLLLFSPSVEHLGLDGTFFVFALIGMITVILVFLIVRETKGVPLEMVQEMYESGYFNWKPGKLLNSSRVS